MNELGGGERGLDEVGVEERELGDVSEAAENLGFHQIPRKLKRFSKCSSRRLRAVKKVRARKGFR